MRIILHIKNKYAGTTTTIDYLASTTIRFLVKKYSDYIRYPIQSWKREKSRQERRRRRNQFEDTYKDIGNAQQHGPSVEEEQEPNLR